MSSIKTINPVTGQLQRLSASSMNAIDTEAYGGCEARWWFRYVAGKKEPQGRGAAIGTKCHQEIEHYLTTGEMTLGPITLAGRRFMPEPGDDLWIEAEVEGIFLEDVPVTGFVDCMHERGETADIHGDPCPLDADLEIIDWKNLASLDRAKKPSDLLKTTQMTVYGKYAVSLGARRVRLSHVTMKTRGRPDALKSTRVHTAEEIEESWNRLVPLARRAKEVAQITDLADVRKNTRSCDAYGGCPHKEYCHVPAKADISRIFGTSGDNTNMSLLKNRKKQSEPTLAVILDEIESFGQGFPQVRGGAMKALADARGMSLSDGALALAGSGALGDITITDEGQFAELLEELRLENAAGVAPAAVLPPDAPASDPEKAAKPIEAEEPPAEEKPKKARKKRATKKVAEEKPSATLPGTVVLVDAVAVGAETHRLEVYVWTIAKGLAEQYHATDVRTASKDSPLGFGAWRGVLAAHVLANPPPPGIYTCSSRGDLMDVALEALSCTEVTIIRGVR